MIYELRTYRLIPGNLPAFLKHAEVGLGIRGESFGRLVGYWSSELGVLNQVFHLWSFESIDERSTLLGKLSKIEDWNTKYLPEARRMIATQENAILNAVMPVAPPSAGPNVYELRKYTAHPGKSQEWLAMFRQSSEVRLTMSHLAGAWLPEIGSLNQIYTLWPYSSLDQRAAIRAKSMAEPTWGEFLKKVPSLLSKMESTILNPTTFSPMK